MNITEWTGLSNSDAVKIHRIVNTGEVSDSASTDSDHETRIIIKKLVPWGTDGRLPLSDPDLDLGSGHTAYRRASVIELYLHTKFH